MSVINDIIEGSIENLSEDEKLELLEEKGDYVYIEPLIGNAGVAYMVSVHEGYEDDFMDNENTTGMNLILDKPDFMDMAFEWGADSYGRAEILVAIEDAYAAYHQGECHDNVRDLMETSYIKKQFDGIDTNVLREYHKECGLEDSEKKTEEELRMFYLFMVCGDIVDRKEEEKIDEDEE